MRSDSLLTSQKGGHRKSRTGITVLDVQVSSYDNRGDRKSPFGFIYFGDYPNYQGHEVRMGYVGGLYVPANEANSTLHEVERYCPYVFTGNWGEPTYSHIVAAWDFAVAEGLSGFAEFEAEHRDTIRWMNGGEYVPADRTTMEMAAIKERQTALRTRPKR